MPLVLVLFTTEDAQGNDQVSTNNKTQQWEPIQPCLGFSPRQVGKKDDFLADLALQHCCPKSLKKTADSSICNFTSQTVTVGFTDMHLSHLFPSFHAIWFNYEFDCFFFAEYKILFLAPYNCVPSQNWYSSLPCCPLA